MRVPVRDAKYGRPPDQKGLVVRRTQCETCNELFHCARGGVRKDVHELYFQYDKLSWLSQLANGSFEVPFRGNTQIRQWQTLPQVDVRRRV